MKFNFLFPLLGFVVGIVLADHDFLGLGLPLVCIGSALLIWLVLHILSASPIRAAKISGLHFLWISILFMGLGAFSYDIKAKTSIERDINGETVKIKGIVNTSRNLAERDDYQIEVLTVTDENGEKIHSRNLGVILRTNGFSAKNGDILEYTSKQQGFYNKPNSSSYRYADMMKHKGIIYQSYLKAEKISKAGHSFSILQIFDNFRESIIIKLEKSSLSKKATGFLVSLLLGERAFLPLSTKETLSAAGLSHILALSGLHVGIILLIFYWLTFPLNFLGYNKLRNILVLLLLWGYVLLTGCSPSTIRAAIMASMVVIALMLQRKNSSLNALFVAIFIILLFDPRSLWDIGLQMSFLCVFAIIVFTARLNPVDHHSHPYLFKTIAIILLSLIITATTWVVTAYYFKQVPLLFLPTNLLLLPFLPLIILCTCLYIVLLALGYDSPLISSLINQFHDIYLYSAETLSAGGDANITINIDGYAVLAWLAGIVLIAVGLYATYKKRKRICYALGGFLCILTIVSVSLNDKKEDNLIFQHSFTTMKAKLTSGNSSHDLIFPRNSISKSKYESTLILAIDTNIKEESVQELKDEIEGMQAFLIVGPGANFSQIANLIENCFFERVILHATIGKNMRQEILNLVDPSNHGKIHSLRENGSLSLSL